MQTTSRLFCKPIRVFHQHEMLYEKKIEELGQRIGFRSFDLNTDLALIHEWVNQPYSKRFWQMDGNIDFLQRVYENILSSDHAHSFIGTLDKIPICLVDVYLVSMDELKEHIGASADDSGLHLLMAPPRLLIKNLSLHSLGEFLSFYFSFPVTATMYAEPDCKNVLANKLAERVGFQFLKQIELSYKTANLYSITKQQFYATNKIS
jgi:hypothetical protein